jgi:hypothetical protein
MATTKGKKSDDNHNKAAGRSRSVRPDGDAVPTAPAKRRAVSTKPATTRAAKKQPDTVAPGGSARPVKPGRAKKPGARPKPHASEVKAVPAPAAGVTIPAEPPRLIDALPPKQQRFVREYLIDLNGTQAAIRAKYSANSAHVIACELLRKPNVAAAIRQEQERISMALEITSEKVVARWQEQFEADPGELTQFRRHPCRNCWGKDHRYQYTPGEFDKAKRDHQMARAQALGKSGGKVDIGEFSGLEGDWYDRGREPNVECPECFGDGVGETFFADTRKLSKKGKALFLGVKEGKDGLEIKIASPEKAGEFLARHLGIFNDSLKVEVAEMTTEALEERFVSKMREAQARQMQVLQERGIDPADD